MAIDYKDKVVIVTGAANGIGQGIANEAAKRGAKVVLVDILGDDLEKAVDQIKAAGGEAVGFQMSVTQQAKWDELKDFVLATYGVPYMLFNNAGIEYDKAYPEFTIADWEYYMATNVYSVVMGTNTFYPIMAEAGGGHIVTTGPTASIGPSAAGVGFPYAPSKHAVLAYMEQIDIWFRMNNIPVQCACIMPCVIKSYIGARLNRIEGCPEEFRDRWDQIENRTQEEKDAVDAMYAMLYAPKGTEVYDQLRAGGVIEVEEGVATIFDDLDHDYFYIYTHPGQSNAVNLGEMALRIKRYARPINEGDFMADYSAHATSFI